MGHMSVSYGWKTGPYNEVSGNKDWHVLVPRGDRRKIAVHLNTVHRFQRMLQSDDLEHRVPPS